MNARLRAAIAPNAAASGMTVEDYFDQLIAEALVTACNEGLKQGLGPVTKADALCEYAMKAMPRIFGATWPDFLEEVARRFNVSKEVADREIQREIINRVVRESA